MADINSLFPETRKKIDTLRAIIDQASRDTQQAVAEIHSIQDECQHEMILEKQINNHSETKWIKYYKCKHCDFRSQEIGLPVCHECGSNTRPLLVRGKQLKIASSHNTPTTFGETYRYRFFSCRGRKCGYTTMLWVEGD